MAFAKSNRDYFAIATPLPKQSGKAKQITTTQPRGRKGIVDMHFRFLSSLFIQGKLYLMQFKGCTVIQARSL